MAHRLSKSEKKAWKARFEEWQSPGELLADAEMLGQKLGDKVFFRQAGLEFITDAWIAGNLARALSASYVRLVAGEWPDFEVEDQASQRHFFEAVEADVPERKRGDEYARIAERRAEGGDASEHFPIEEIQRRNDLVGPALATAAQKKVSKSYSSRINLVIYLNFGGEFGVREKTIIAQLHQSTVAARNAFSEVWVLWREQAFLLWRGGICVPF